ncbi:MAG: universal stress protein [Sphingomonadales bacterium]
MSFEPANPPSAADAKRAKRRYRKFCVVVDGSEESYAALRFAAGRAAHTIGGRVTLFCALAPASGGHWVAVQEKMDEEAREEAEAELSKTADAIFDYVGLRSEIVILQGDLKETLQKHLAEDDTLFALILGARPGAAPGALVDFFSGDVAGTLPCPVVIVPGALDPARIDAIV